MKFSEQKDGDNSICKVYLVTGSKISIFKQGKDVIFPSFRNVVFKTFLPNSYPSSVRSEYLQYQLWDSVQGISSYLRSVLTTRSVLSGAGVGSSSSTPLAAALSWVFKDGVGELLAK
jgi:hypothetical protein